MDAAVATLQNTVNRFALVGGFPRVAVDGVWGSSTRQSVTSTLSWIGQAKCYRTACTTHEDAQSAGQLIVQWDEQPSAARGLAEFFGRVADDLGIPHVPAPITGGGGTPAPGPLVHVSQPGILERFKTLPFWQQIAMGLIAGLGLIFFVNRFSRSKQPRRTKRAA